ncbi:DUF6120 family protein [Faecalimonas sp.]
MTIHEKYLKEVSKRQEVKGNKGKKFIENLSNDVEEYLIENPQATYNEVVENFGTPQKIVDEFLLNQDSEDLLKNIKKKKHIKIFVVFLIVICVLGMGIYWWYWKKLYKDTMKENIKGYDTQIEIIESEEE